MVIYFFTYRDAWDGEEGKGAWKEM